MDLDKAIRSNKRIAKCRFLFSGIFFVLGMFVFVGFAIPLLQVAGDAVISPYEWLAMLSAVFVVVAVPFFVGAWSYMMGLMYEQTAMHYRLRVLEQKLDMEVA